VVRFPVGCKRFLRSPAGPAFYSMGTGPRSPGMKGPEREADHSSFSAVTVCTGTTVSVPGVKLFSTGSFGAYSRLRKHCTCVAFYFSAETNNPESKTSVRQLVVLCNTKCTGYMYTEIPNILQYRQL